jgi:hypothetical protein
MFLFKKLLFLLKVIIVIIVVIERGRILQSNIL